LIVGRYSLFLVEIKSRPGEVGGDSHTWVWRDGGRDFLDDNPLLLTNRKAKKLASLLRQQLNLHKAADTLHSGAGFPVGPGAEMQASGGCLGERSSPVRHRHEAFRRGAHALQPTAHRSGSIYGHPSGSRSHRHPSPAAQPARR
jgi:hypothetical protein